MYRVLALVLVFCVWAGPGSAADVFIEAGVADQPIFVRPSYIWAGYYLGIYAGGAFGNSSHDTPSGPLISLATGNFPVSGPMVGGTIGFNFQKDNLVAGIEFDAGWGNIKGSTTNNCSGTVCETSNPGIVTLRARLGYAFDRILPFATIGVALGDVRAEVIGSGATNPQKAGLAVGAGVEYALGINWIAKLEYLYVDFGKTTCSDCDPGFADTVTLKINVLRAGLNYKFDW
jgi:outer membrane immunogenic protein